MNLPSPRAINWAPAFSSASLIFSLPTYSPWTAWSGPALAGSVKAWLVSFFGGCFLSPPSSCRPASPRTSAAPRSHRHMVHLLVSVPAALPVSTANLGPQFTVSVLPGLPGWQTKGRGQLATLPDYTHPTPRFSPL